MFNEAVLSPAQRRRWFWISLVITLSVMGIMNLVGEPLINPVAPAGIVSYELAWKLGQARAILDSWDGRARLYAAFGLGFDYVFMLAYAVTFALACRMAGDALDRRKWPLSGLGRSLAAGMFLAALFDAVENLALSLMLLDAPAEPWPSVAGVCASLKFGLLFIGLVYAFFGLVGALLERLDPGSSPGTKASY